MVVAVEAWARCAACAIALVMLSGCQGRADDGAFIATRALPTQRHDIVQAIAARGERVVAGTQSGALLTSSDGGATWTRHELGQHSFVALAGCPDGSFFAADFYHHVVRIGPDGEPDQVLPLAKPETPLAAACDPQGRWWIAGTYATVAMSADQGASWTVQNLGEDAQLTAVQFIDAERAVLVGEFGLLFRSADGGATWSRGPAAPNDFYPYAAWFISAEEGWLSGIAGQVLHTLDGGAAWVRESNETGAPLYHLFALDGRMLGVGPAGLVRRDADAVWRALSRQSDLPAYIGTAAPINAGDSAVVVGGAGAPRRIDAPIG